MSKEKAIIIIPTYNEEENIANTIQLVLQQTDSLDDFQVEILVFDSQSTDNTATLVNDLAQRFPGIIHFASEAQKTGLGSAYIQAMNRAIDVLQADIVFEFDADGSHQPMYIPAMLELLKTHDVVVGSRYIPGGSMPKDWGIHRKLLSRGGNWIARLLLTNKFKDLTSGMRATRTSVLKKVLPDRFLSNHYAYKLHLYWLLFQAKAKIIEYPITFIDREKGYSKLPKNSIVDSIRVLINLRFNKLKQYIIMCLVGSLGALIQFSCYSVLRSYDFSPFIASQIAMSIAILSNFTLNSRITFKRHKINTPLQKSALLSRLTQFILYSIGMIYLQSTWVSLAVDYFGSGVTKEGIIVLFGIYIGSMINYLFYSTVIWSNRSRT